MATLGSLASMVKGLRWKGVSGRRAVVIGLMLFFVGCTQVGPQLMQAGRNDYNKVLAQTNDEETLLNLVRLRYADNPTMLQVTSISTSFNWTHGADAEIVDFESSSSDSHTGVRGSLSYSEKPTVTYSPLGGSDFVEKMLEPLELETLLLLSRSGWRVDRLLRVTADRISGIGNAPQASGPTPSDVPDYEEFIHAAKLMRTLQKNGNVAFGYRMLEGEKVFGMLIDPQARKSDAVRELSSYLGLAPNQRMITLDTRSRRPRTGSIGIRLRSVVGIMFFLSHAVEVPEHDKEAGRVTITRHENGEPFDWSEVVGDLLEIKSQSDYPANAAVAVQYRGSWFYIDDSDMNSKYTFMLMNQITALEAGGIKQAGPILTLPVAAP